MPITIPDGLPARNFLEQEGVQIMGETDAIRQDVRPLKIALLNLMPNKERTECQIARLVGSTPLQVELTLMTTDSYIPTHVSKHHMASFYTTWDQIKDEKFDALIVTGAPIETMEFEDVTYWKELTKIYDWTQTNVHSTLNICWGAQASLYHFRKVPKRLLPEKMFGVFDHDVTKQGTSLLRGFNDTFPIPVSRHTETRIEDLPVDPSLTVLASSPDSGLCLVQDTKYRQIGIFNHVEYDDVTLAEEYDRDVREAKPIQLPKHYFPNDDPSKRPVNRWRAHAHLLFGNWINDVYQTTPYDSSKIGS